MAIFPTLTPSSRTYTPGEYPHSPFQGMSGAQNRTRHSNVMLSSQLRLGFIALTEAEMLSILSHYQGQLGTFTSFTLPSAVWSGVSSTADYQLASYGWRYIEPPTVEDLMCGGHNVELVLETVPPEGTALAGLASILAMNLLAGSAAAANGLSESIDALFSPGLGIAPLPGLNETLSLTVEAGEAIGSIAGLTSTIDASLIPGTAAVANGGNIAITTSLSPGTASVPLPKLIGSFINSNSATDTSQALTVPTHAAGDLLVAVLMWRSSHGGITVPSGWSLYGTYMSSIILSGSQQNLLVYTKVAGSSEPASYTWSAVNPARNCGLMASIRGGTIAQITENYGNGATATITTAANRLNITAFTWLHVDASGTESYSQTAASGSLTQITDSPKSIARLSGGVIASATTVTSTHLGTSTDNSPNHGGICIQLA